MESSGRLRWRVSVKGVVFQRGRVLLLRNERHEWELPGGSLERGESPAGCVVREIREETGLVVRCGPLLDTWVYSVSPAAGEVLIITYGCSPADPDATPTMSDEHLELGLFDPDELADVPMPDGYRASIRAMRALAPTPPGPVYPTG